MTQTACTPPYTSVPPCPRSDARTFGIALERMTPGTHAVSGTITDAAGNVTRWGPVAFTVARPPEVPSPVVTVSRAPGGARVAAAYSTTASPPRLRLAAPRRARTPGKPARITGTLRTAGGAPIRGARLTVTTLDLGVRRARPRTLPSSVTDANGRFTATLRRDGAQRVTVAYAPRAGAAATALASVAVRTRLALKAAPDRGRLVKGRVLTLTGRLRGAGPSAAGVPVRIESIVNGKWTAVGAIKTGTGGRFRWRYRFVHLMRDTRFSFRAVVDSAPGWPWGRVVGRRVLVDVDIP